MSIFEVTAAPSPRIAAPAAVQPVKAAEAPAPAPLEPAVRVDIGTGDRGGLTSDEHGRLRGEAAPAPSSDERRITIDEETKSIVYQVLDPESGNVLIQLPDPSVLKSRAYVEAQAAQKKAADKPFDRKA